MRKETVKRAILVTKASEQLSKEIDEVLKDEKRTESSIASLLEEKENEPDGRRT